MLLKYIIFMIPLCSLFSSTKEQSICHYDNEYNFLETSDFQNSKKDQYQIFKECSIEQLPKYVNYTIMLDSQEKPSRGVVKVEFRSTAKCRYKIAFVIGHLVNTSNDCMNYEFNKNVTLDEEIHTPEQSICPAAFDSSTEQERIENVNRVTLWYNYVYTGCYALRFNFGNSYMFVGKKFLQTGYKKNDILEPVFQCSYQSVLEKNKSHSDTAMVTSDISVIGGSSGLMLGISLIPLSKTNENDACIHYSGDPILTWKMQMAEQDSMNVNCSIQKFGAMNNTHSHTVDCNFLIQVPKDKGICFLIRILDERCHKHTSWNPPLKDKVPCSWMQSCLEIKPKIVSGIETNNFISIKHLLFPSIVYSIIFVIVFGIILILLGLLVVIYQIFKTKKASMTTFNNDLKFSDMNKSLESGIDDSLKEKLICKTGIVIFYVGGTDLFMSFMSEFRNVLEKRIGTNVYDWWAPDKWNEVASLGGYEWGSKMIKKGYKVIWIDTLKARLLLNTKMKNGYKENINTKYLLPDECDIKDFRDTVFASVVDFAKRSSQSKEFEYKKHFVVRLENFDMADKIEDPFADLSPHARYMIPLNWDKLCYHLTDYEQIAEEELSLDKLEFKKYLSEDSGIDL